MKQFIAVLLTGLCLTALDVQAAAAEDATTTAAASGGGGGFAGVGYGDSDVAAAAAGAVTTATPAPGGNLETWSEIIASNIRTCEACIENIKKLEGANHESILAIKALEGASTLQANPDDEALKIRISTLHKIRDDLQQTYPRLQALLQDSQANLAVTLIYQRWVQTSAPVSAPAPSRAGAETVAPATEGTPAPASAPPQAEAAAATEGTAPAAVPAVAPSQSPSCCILQ